MPRLKWHAKDIPGKCTAVEGKRTVWQFQGVPNLALDCLPTGERVWRCKYVIRKGGKRVDRAVALGQLGYRADQLLPGQARDRRDAIMARVNAGEDVFVTERERAASSDASKSFATLFADWLEQHAKKRKKTWAQDADLHQLYLSKLLDHRTVAEITRKDIADVLDKIAETAPRRADLATDMLSSMWNWAIDSGRAETNPAARQRPRHQSKPRTRVLTDDELRNFWRTLDERERGHQMARGIKLLILTGSRINEVIGASKSEIAGDVWTKPAIRMKNNDPHAVPLTGAAKALFVAAAGESDQRTNEFNQAVFTGRTGSGRETYDAHACSRAVRDLMKVVGIQASAHDFRRTMATRLSELRVPTEIIERLLSHRGGRTTVTGRHYVHDDKLPEKRRALELWDRYVTRVVAGGFGPPEYWRW